jgi:hypothetical protein
MPSNSQRFRAGLELFSRSLGWGGNCIANCGGQQTLSAPKLQRIPSCACKIDFIFMSAFSDLPGEVHETPKTTSVLVMPPPKPTRSQIWMHRVWLVVFVLFCLEVGIVLMVGPWTKAWTENSLTTSFPALRDLLMNDFVRGAITGLGLVDFWIGISRALSYRETVS